MPRRASLNTHSHSTALDQQPPLVCLFCLCNLILHTVPGYGWSSPPTKRGCNITAVAATLDALMVALGYNHYVAQGGDWGAIACRALAV
jgi:pimeloyl-ACP methyl ester carboxylesterase